MQKLFNKILVPVDFSSRSNTAVEKAIEIAQHYHCSIHLLHVVTSIPFSVLAMPDGHANVPYNMIDNKKELEFQLDKICDRIQLLTGHSIVAEHSIMNGNWNQTIVDFTFDNKIDLILIGQVSQFFQKRKMLLNPDFIAEKANVPVITIPDNRRLTRLYSIVIPITDFLPVRKLMYGVYIALSFDCTIKLLGIENLDTKEKVQHYLLKATRLIKENCKLNVEVETVEGQNVAAAVNQFAVLKAADLIIVNPGLQTKMPGFLASLLGNILQKYSAPPVLTVNRS